jgi:hypothetical protein
MRLSTGQESEYFRSTANLSTNIRNLKKAVQKILRLNCVYFIAVRAHTENRECDTDMGFLTSRFLRINNCLQ